MNQILTLISHVVKHSGHAMAIIQAVTRFLTVEHLQELIEYLKRALSKAEQVEADVKAMVVPDEPSEPETAPAADAAEPAAETPAVEEAATLKPATWKPGKK